MNRLKELTNEIYEQMKYYRFKNSSDAWDFWIDVISGYKLSEDIMKEFLLEINWHTATRRQNLSEDFIIELENIWDSWHWKNIAQYQVLSYEFIIKFIKKINIYYLKNNEYLKLNLTESQWKTIEFLKRL